MILELIWALTPLRQKLLLTKLSCCLPLIFGADDLGKRPDRTDDRQQKHENNEQDPSKLCKANFRKSGSFLCDPCYWHLASVMGYCSATATCPDFLPSLPIFLKSPYSLATYFRDVMKQFMMPSPHRAKVEVCSKGWEWRELFATADTRIYPSNWQVKMSHWVDSLSLFSDKCELLLAIRQITNINDIRTMIDNKMISKIRVPEK